MKTPHLFRNMLFFLPVLLVQPSLVSAQTDSLFDCFPLTVGNQWTYRYLYSNWTYETAEYWTRNDSGVVSQEIVARVDYPDSILWTFSQHRTYHDHQGSVARGYIDTTLNDSMIYVLVELKCDRHRLYQQVPYDGRDWHYLSAFATVYPFWRDPWDSLLVYRFNVVDSASQASFNRFGFGMRPNSRSFTLKKGVGLDSLETEGSVTLDFEQSRFLLVNEVITGVERNPGGDLPDAISLYQNYPNPFNPRTTIRYALPKRSHVTLTVFNVLGQQVATLVNGEVETGYHDVRFKAEGLASGVYFYRLRAGEAVQTRKLLLLR